MEERQRATIRPYARLLTMLGEQLIKNDRVALVELVKNSYDADASQVVVDFRAFSEEFTSSAHSSIVVQDNGTGMSFEVVRDHWLNPATDIKAARKHTNPLTELGRIIQGEKGIGRFAAFKIGSRCRLVTRAAGDEYETVVDYDITFLDDVADESLPGEPKKTLAVERNRDSEGASDESEEPVKFLDQVPIYLSTRVPEVFVDGTLESHGTRIEISALRSDWGWAAIEGAHSDLLRLQPLRGLLTGDVPKSESTFSIEFTKDGSHIESLLDTTLRLRGLNERAVLKVLGYFESSGQFFNLTVNEITRKIWLHDPEVRGLWYFKKYFEEQLGLKKGDDIRLECGDFSFEFLVFDIRQNAPAEFRLDEEERDLVRRHRIYLYRDGIRVLPYGDADDDWLQIDALRGNQGANRVLSNDQTVGLVYISQSENKDLRDKTSREGLVDSGRPYTDFKAGLLLITILVRKREFSEYLVGLSRQADARARAAGRVSDQIIKELESRFVDDKDVSVRLRKLARELRVERDFADTRVKRTEQLAGVGLSVETASHDIIASGARTLDDARLLRQEIGYELGKASPLYARGGRVADGVSFVVSRLSDVQGLFVSTRRGARRQDVVPFVRKVVHLFEGILSSSGIDVTIDGDPRLVARVSEAALLQIFLNLLDNSVYWLQRSVTTKPRVTIHVDAGANEVIVSDNGPGVDPADAPFIFDAFYSAKGDEGRGLGLYIADQIARREGLTVALRDDGQPGATFVVGFK